MRSKFDDQDELDRMRLDPDNYKWGIFYFNPKDSRIILPKRNPYMGFTVNFANPLSYIIIILLFAFGLFLSNLQKFINGWHEISSTMKKQKILIYVVKWLALIFLAYLTVKESNSRILMLLLIGFVSAILIWEGIRDFKVKSN
jgi:hypothetical protein